jgi:hypothetical protein
VGGCSLNAYVALDGGAGAGAMGGASGADAMGGSAGAGAMGGAGGADAMGGSAGAGASDASGGSGGSQGGAAGGGAGGASPATCAELALAERPPSQCSANSNQPATLTVVNQCATESVKLYWVNYDCGEQPYATIPPGATYTQGTYVTHPWRLRNAATNQLLAETGPLAGGLTLAVP